MVRPLLGRQRLLRQLHHAKPCHVFGRKSRDRRQHDLLAESKSARRLKRTWQPRQGWPVLKRDGRNNAMRRCAETLAGIRVLRPLGAAGIQRLNSQCVWRRSAPKEWLAGYHEDKGDVLFVVKGAA